MKKKGLEIFAYVIMSTHLHLIASARNENLSSIIRDFKKFTSGILFKKIKDENHTTNKWMLDIFNTGGTLQHKKSKNQIWQYNNHAEEVYSAKFTLSKIRYIHNNPVEAGLVDRVEDFHFSSARDYAGFVGPVKVSVLNLHNLF